MIEVLNPELLRFSFLLGLLMILLPLSLKVPLFAPASLE